MAPTPMLAGVAPWADPTLVATIRAEAGAVNGVLLDPVSQTIPWSRAARDDLLFNPAQGGGAALLGNGQSAVLFPTEAASRLLAPYRAVTYSQAARLLLAAWGAFLLIRVAGFSDLGATVSAAVFVGAGFVQLWRLHPHSLVAAAAPWILAAALVLYRRPGPGTATLLAAAGALGVAGGHPETLLHVMLLAALVVPALARLPAGVAASSPRAPIERLVWGATAAVLSFLLAAPVLLPFAETLAVSNEWTQQRPLGRTMVEAPLRDAIERMRPAGALLALGDPVSGTWRGPENLAELGGAATGGAALFLATLALFMTRGGAARAATLYIAAVGLLGLAVGAHTPVVSAPFGWIPLLQDTLLKRLSLWWVLAVTLLAAAAVDGVAARVASGKQRRALGSAAIAAALVTLVLVLLAIGDAPRPEALHMLIVEGGAVAVALLAFALLAVRHQRRARVILGVALLMAALVVPRAALFARWVPVTPPESFYPGTDAMRVLLDRLSALPRAGFRVTGLEAALAPHSAAFFGLEEIRPYDPMTFAPYQQFLTAVANEPTGSWVRVTDPGAPALAFLGVRFLLEDPPPPLPVDPQEAKRVVAGRWLRRAAYSRAGLRIAYEGSDAVLWERADALPRVFFPQTWRLGDGIGALEAAARIEDFAELAIVDRPPAPAIATLDAAAVNPAARVLALEVGRGSIEVDVESSGAAILASSQPAIPGWRLTVDGAGADDRLRRINSAFLGVAVPQGTHRVFLRFAPASWRLGLLLAACGGLAATILLLFDRRRRRT